MQWLRKSNKHFSRGWRRLPMFLFWLITCYPSDMDSLFNNKCNIIAAGLYWRTMEHTVAFVVCQGRCHTDLPIVTDSTDIITYLVSCRRSIEIWRVCKIYGRRGGAEPSIYFTNPPYFYRPSATDQISVLFRRGPWIMYIVAKIGKKINADFIHIRQSFARENVTLRLARTTS